MTVNKYKCPNCGSTIKIVENTKYDKCQICGKQLILYGETYWMKK